MRLCVTLVSKLCVLSCLLLVLWASHARVASAGFITLDFSDSHNCRLQTFGGPPELVAQLPEGDVTLGGVPFSIPVGGNNAWHSTSAFGYNSGPNPRIVDVNVGTPGTHTVHTLINSFGGILGGPYAWLEFYGQNPVTPLFTKNLFGNDDIRDVLENTWNNDINGTSTVNVFSAGPGGFNNEVRLDMQTIVLPSVFETDALTRIRLVDNGPINDTQRTFLAGVTVDAVPEPSTLVLFAGLTLCVVIAGWWRRRRLVL